MRINRVQLVTLFFLLFTYSCKSHSTKRGYSNAVEQLLHRKSICKLPGGEKYDSSKYVGVRNAAYAYNYMYPKAFKDSTIDVLDESGVLLSDTTYSASADKHAVMRIWIGDTIPFPLGAMNDSLKESDFSRADSAVARTVAKLQRSEYPYLKGALIDNVCRSYDGYNQQILVMGHTNKNVIIYKIDISEIPVSGDLIFKNMVFTYDKGYEKQYHKTAITIVNDFSGPF